ncbi:MAG: helix-turn-helix domain-containing protein [Comamonas sp.]|jgi:DNA-binding transcriptional MerR regulator|uniref:helix-turn-helix domain-containing protein n=1 Tax=Comamonas sp. TaxID=34028 RepID=UPI00282F0DE0|nr:helix-turn-helix domain-containing protein [Comamonas sp.]MDR0214111.1 helix-turn-helix domain-containing protein [Comamonas sp.]
MDISEVSRCTGLPSSTVRFYAKKGLISAISAAGERRRFQPEVLDQLALIALGQAGGLSLDEIAAMLTPGGTPRVDRLLLRKKADEIDATVRHLQAMSQGLRHAAECSAPSHMQCPKFQRLIKAAATGRLKPQIADMPRKKNANSR